MLLREEAQHLELLEDMTAKRFTIIPVRDIHIKRYEIIWNE